MKNAESLLLGQIILRFNDPSAFIQCDFVFTTRFFQNFVKNIIHSVRRKNYCPYRKSSYSFVQLSCFCSCSCSCSNFKPDGLGARSRARAGARKTSIKLYGISYNINIGGADTNLKKGYKTIGDILFSDEDPRTFLTAIYRLSPLFIEVDLDIVRVQDAGLSGADDPEVLEWAAGENRILLTHDISTITKYAYDRVAAGKTMPGSC